MVAAARIASPAKGAYAITFHRLAITAEQIDLLIFQKYTIHR
jgi:hypothetical protein